MPPDRTKSRTTVRFTPEQLERIDAERGDVPREQFIRIGMNAYLESLKAERRTSSLPVRPPAAPAGHRTSSQAKSSIRKSSLEE